MSNQEKLKTARTLLSEVSNSWDESAVECYEASMSFDELVAELYAIELKN